LYVPHPPLFSSFYKFQSSYDPHLRLSKDHLSIP
jgi:hypothetical protein